MAHTSQSGAATNTMQIASSVGDCVYDTFVVTSTTKGSPVICGENTGAHSKFNLMKK